MPVAVDVPAPGRGGAARRPRRSLRLCVDDAQRAENRSVPSWLDLDPTFLALGATPDERAEKYAEFASAAISGSEWNFIRVAVQRGQLTGSRSFADEVEHRLGRRIDWRGGGRP